VIDLALKGRFDQAGIAAIAKQIQLQKPDILHAFNNKTLSNSLRASKGVPLKIIAYRGIEANVSYWDPASWTTYLHPRVDVIVCVADAIRRYFYSMRFLGLPFPVRKARTIYKGHDPSWYTAEAADLSQFGVPKNAFVIGCTVNDRPRKGLEYLARATYLLPADAPIFWLLIGKIGNPKLSKLIAESPNADKIKLLGFRRDVPALIKACDVCILPSIKREGLPKGIIEGMIQGVAPVVTDSGGSPELVEQGISGLIIPPKSPKAIAEAVMKLYGDPQKTSELKCAAKLRIEQCFNVADTIDQHLALYREMVAGKV
jgi:glycosyltransferase involved in cell wall biosynthesis